MQNIILRASSTLALSLSLCALTTAQQIGKPVQTTLSDQVAVPKNGLPGRHAGTEIWIVHFKSRSFDLEKFRNAIYARRPAREVDTIVAEIERKMASDQRAFVTEVEDQLDAKVIAQWWLINALALEIKPKNLAALRKMKRVASIEPDQEWVPVIKTATNSSNHNSDFVNSVLKQTGAGVATGIVDTGQDQAMGSLTRPHRTYFKLGNASNTTGTGIGGSRLVLNRKMGSQAADDVHGHGTGVASIVAGGKWGSSSADHGHAYDANIAGYSIANNTAGSSSSTVMANAWQQMAKDRATYKIVSANLSYSGSPSLTNTAQQAIDSASYNADIMICTAAGNSGSRSSSSQSNANGLCVAAINENRHTVASFSSRGPLSGSGGRFFPDIAGCGVSTNMARRNSENTDYVGSGTSMASPQVCGTATLVRGANTALTALETKALLLATSQSIAAANGSLDRNAYGMGMSRDDLAVTMALSKKGFGTGTLTSSTKTKTVSFSITKGKVYACAVAWHRATFNTTSYSNLDMKLLEGATLIAESKTPKNFYEMVRFLAKKTGTISLQVTATSLVGTSQKFSYAFTEAPKAPIPGQISTFGQGCLGSGTPPPPTCMSGNTTRTSRTSTGFAGVRYMLEMTAGKALDVAGYEMLTRSSRSGSVTVNTWLYSATTGGQPNAVLASGTMTIGSSAAFYKTTFSKTVKFAQGTKFFIGFTNSNPTFNLGTVTSGTVTPYWRNNGTNGSWIRFTTRAWGWKVTCVSTGSGAVPAASATGTPDIGQTVTLRLDHALGSAKTVLLSGLSKADWFGLKLPFDMTAINAKGCFILAAGHFMAFGQAGSNGSQTVSYKLPAITDLIGVRVYHQFGVEDGKANGFGFAMSNGVEVLIGGTPK